ncbi:MAG: response regulator [Nitrospinota bacterium]|nr:response regulator [Nitrospinota bacterium]
MADIILTGSGEESFGGLERALENKGEPYKRIGIELTDPGFSETVGGEYPAVIVARFHEGDLASIKAMQSYRLQKPCTQFIFLSNKLISPAILTLMFNEGAFGILEEPISEEGAHLLLKQAIKKSKWDMEDQARSQELSQLNRALQAKVDHLEISRSRLRELVDKLERMLLKTLSNNLFKTSKVKVLLVSASDYQRNVLSEDIRRVGFTVEALKDGQSALAELKKIKPSILICDLELDDMSGVELASIIKSDSTYPNIYLIVITSSPEKIEGIMGPGGKVDDCVLKPTSAAGHYQLIARVALGALNL